MKSVFSNMVCLVAIVALGGCGASDHGGPAPGGQGGAPPTGGSGGSPQPDSGELRDASAIGGATAPIDAAPSPPIVSVDGPVGAPAQGPDAELSVKDAGAGAMGGSTDGGDSWDGFAMAFFTKYCGSCHNDDQKGDATRDYHMITAVMREKAEIACGVSKSQGDWSRRGCSGFPPARQFPVGGGPKPTDAERDRLLLWIDSGTP